jgi:colicin import membrane protein/protein TonB
VTALEASALRRHDRIWPAVLASALLHVVLGGWALTHRAGPELDPGQKPIVAKLVRLGEKRPETLLPRKEEAPPPPAPSPAAAPVAAPAAPKAAPVLAGAKPRPAPTAPPAEGGKPGGDPLSRVMSKLEREKAAEGPRWGDPEGDPEGDADEAGEGDRYLAKAVRALQANYRVPATISEQERLHLRATVVLFIDPSGAIRDFRFEARSGNGAFDAALERAIHATRLPVPPDAMKDAYRRVGLGVNFHF